MRSAGSSKRRCGLVACQHDLDAEQAAQAFRDVTDHVGRQVDRRERTERAVVHDVGIGDRQDHARAFAAEPLVQ